MLEEARQEERRAILLTHCPPRSTADGILHALDDASTIALKTAVSGHDVAPIFAAHIHRTLLYGWNSIPSYVTALSEKTWQSKPAKYCLGSVRGKRLLLKMVHVTPQLAGNDPTLRG